jgi:hypothetical protein
MLGVIVVALLVLVIMAMLVVVFVRDLASVLFAVYRD